MQRRSILTFVDRDLRLREATQEDCFKNDQVALGSYLLVDSKSGEIVAMVYEEHLFDQDGNHFEDAP